jgi:alkaline phosphatase
MHWHSDEHTNQLVPFYAKGAGSAFFEKMTFGIDPVHGAYIDNTAIGRKVVGMITSR